MIIGGSIEGLILSILSAEEHNVTLIDIHPEIGFPCTIPGWLVKKESLQKYFNADQLKQMNVFPNDKGFSVSGEWLFKLLTIKAVRAGVNVLLRCRVTNINSSSKETAIQYVGGINSGGGKINCDVLFDLTDYCAISPGNLQHNIPRSATSKPNRPQIHYWGGLALLEDCQNNKLQPTLQLIRKDGLCELWFEEKPTWAPSSGWIETMQNTTLGSLAEMNIDNSISHGEQLFESINQQ